MFNTHRKTEMKKLLAVLAMVVSTSLFAATQTTVDVSKLTAEQKAQINKQVAELAAEPTNVSATVRKEAEAWSELGANMGKAMVGAAREVGVAANEFSQTDLGKIVVAMVAFKIAGRDILGIVVGSLILVFGYGLALWLAVTARWSTVKYEYEPILWGMIKKQRILSISTEEDVVTMKMIGCAILLALTTIVGLNVIF